MLTVETIQHNCECFKEQMSRFIEFGNDNLECIREKLLYRFPLGGKDGGEDLFVWMFVNNDALKDFILAGKVIVDAAQRQVSLFCDLPHG